MRTTGTDPYDVAVIGAGSTRLYAAFYAGMRNLRTLVLEARPRPGGQITALYPEQYIYDVSGYPFILGRDLVAEFFKQASQFGADFRFNKWVEVGVRYAVHPREDFLGRRRLIVGGGDTAIAWALELHPLETSFGPSPGKEIQTVDDRVRSDDVFFAATGVNDGAFLRSVQSGREPSASSASRAGPEYHSTGDDTCFLGQSWGLYLRIRPGLTRYGLCL
ncbi:MAG: NAD(P)-binding protein [Acidobacteria bacterium]|nr:NAD(P)-binding protein [Acidobacteriota bacterium]MDW7983717.1 NAD(P)-binding protein [Acidobacteriota bacterium]